VSHAERRQLRPQAPHHLGTRHGEHHVDAWARRGLPLELASHRHAAIASGFDGADAERTIEQADADRLAWRHAEDVEEVRRTRARERDPLRVDAVALFQEDQIHQGFELIGV
jgi:hypothetical protein